MGSVHLLICCLCDFSSDYSKEHHNDIYLNQIFILKQNLHTCTSKFRIAQRLMTFYVFCVAKLIVTWI